MKFNALAATLGVILGVCSNTAMAAENLFLPLENRERIADPGELLRQVVADPANARIEIVSARADLANESNLMIRLNLPGGIVASATRTGFERMESGNEVWTGQISFASNARVDDSNPTALDAALNTIILVRSGDTLMGTIRIGGELYRLVPIDGGAHALIEVDQTRFLPDEDEAGYKEMMTSPHNEQFLDKAGNQIKAISTIRVLVAFGPAATSAIGNEQQATDLAFAEANQALSATNTDVRFQQAGAIVYFTQSESTNYSTMLNRLTNLSDGYYDTIGSQRNSNTADLVAYVGPASATLCGQAAGIATSSGSAYFVMSPSCLSGNFTFVHEAGHVVGTRHDNDPTTSPYAYGHGYVMSSINRRTVMAVNNGPCSSCTRIGAFSSPNYTLSGVTIGTTSTNDNNRVWRTRGATVAAFR